jgi:protein SCO1/2
VGFKYRWDESQQQFSHASVAYVVTPDGNLSRYLYGIEFDPQTVRLALTEASSGKIGNIVDQMILFCFHFDPSKNKYTLYAFNIMRAGAILIVVALAFILIPAWRRERRKLTPLKGEGI